MPDVHGECPVGQAGPRRLWRHDRRRQPPLPPDSYSRERSGQALGYNLRRGRAGATRSVLFAVHSPEYAEGLSHLEFAQGILLTILDSRRERRRSSQERYGFDACIRVGFVAGGLGPRADAARDRAAVVARFLLVFAGAAETTRRQDGGFGGAAGACWRSARRPALLPGPRCSSDRAWRGHRKLRSSGPVTSRNRAGSRRNGSNRGNPF